MKNTSQYNLIRKLGFRILRYSGLPAFFREFKQKRKVTILLFHDIPVVTAEQTFKFLLKKYNIISLDQFINASKQKDRSQIPAKAAIITFDDGFKQNYELLPVFKKYNIPVTIFVCAELIDTNRHFWFEENYTNYSIDKLKKMANHKKLNILKENGFYPEKEYDMPQVLSRTQINEMKESVNFQSHTLFHPCLPKCSVEEAKTEIISSKKKLENEYGLRINALAYPNGDYSERDIQLTKEAGYECAVTVDSGLNSMVTDLFRLKRICVNDTDDINELIVKASGLWNIFKPRNGWNQVLN